MGERAADFTVDKEFLKRDEFADAVSRTAEFVRTYRAPLLLLALILAGVLVGAPLMRYYRNSRVEDLGRLLFQAQTELLKKETLYKDIAARFGDLPASRLAQVHLADYYVDHQEPDKALAVLDEALALENEPVMATLLSLKKAAVLSGRKKYKEAADFLAAKEGAVLPGFQSRLDLIRADFLLAAGDKEGAKSVYQGLVDSIASAGQGDDSGEGAFDPRVIQFARDRLTLIQLGLM